MLEKHVNERFIKLIVLQMKQLHIFKLKLDQVERSIGQAHQISHVLVWVYVDVAKHCLTDRIEFFIVEHKSKIGLILRK